jgi:hypothetical protein
MEKLTVSRSGERQAISQMAFARERLQIVPELLYDQGFKLSQNYYLTVFSCLFSDFFVKRDTIQANIQFQY